MTSSRKTNNTPKTQTHRPPENRRKTGGKRLFGKSLDPAVGKETQFRPGESGNPAGRPKRHPVTQALRLLLESHQGRGKDGAAVVARKIYEKARKGDATFVRLLLERVEGQVVQVHQHAGDDDLPPINVNVGDARERAIERLKAVIQRIRDRQQQEDAEAVQGSA